MRYLIKINAYLEDFFNENNNLKKYDVDNEKNISDLVKKLFEKILNYLNLK